jgi:hypothetical protein
MGMHGNVHVIFTAVLRGKAFLQWIVTGNKMWVHHREPASKLQSMACKHVIAQDQEIQKCAFCHQSDVDTVLGLQWGCP